MKTIQSTVKGTTPLLMCRFNEVPAEKTRKSLVSYGTPAEEAEKYCYRDATGKFYMPSTAIFRLLRESAGNHKMRGTRKSAKYAVPGAIVVTPDAITLTNGDGRTQLDAYGVDSRSVVIPATRGRIMCHRPKFTNWSLAFTLEIDDEILPPDFVKQLLVEGGRRQGIGSFRPNCGGQFGCFIVTEWSEK